MEEVDKGFRLPAPLVSNNLFFVCSDSIINYQRQYNFC